MEKAERSRMVEREMKLLTECGKLLNGYSKSFRNTWAELNLPDRVVWLEELYREALFEKSVGAI